ncbi:hypothetical protein JHJ32_06650 [Parapedobacter sp. ISTM3]|uniref:hypothetical protein n=1 Tax=Parapedobacter sp. ISTM3 TaxID=2800130 RepID=UPI001903562D|nr:hypothetical protein [Parapedobacter sp. ISTM3]MBK1439658.1 hypothetical protein [Parapedobacter sp. ISTM3]
MMTSRIALLLFVVYLLASCLPSARKPVTDEAKVDSLLAFHSRTLFEDLAEDFSLDYRPMPVSAKPYSQAPEGCYDAILESLDKLGIKELDTLSWAIEMKRRTEWDSLFFGDKFKLVPDDTIRSIFADDSRWWGYFNEHIGPGFLRFSLPIFFNDYHYALVYASENCGGLCGYGAWMIMRREEKHWVKVDEHCFWIS